MTAIRNHLPVSEAGAYLFPNGERHLRTLEALLGSTRKPCWRKP